MSESNINVIQFGTGNFLRGFIEPLFQKLKDDALWEPKIALVQSTNSNSIKRLEETNFNYPLWLAGLKDGNEINEELQINVIRQGIKLPDQQNDFFKLAESNDLEFVISNVTEAGFKLETEKDYPTFPNSFPARLTHFLYRRFEFFKGDNTKGLYFLPCELIKNNGDKLREMILEQSKIWGLSEEFEVWVIDSNLFYNTLVDRIITGLPSNSTLEKYGPNSKFHPSRVQGEPYFFFGIEERKGSHQETILHHPALPITFTESLTPFSLRKVRILNGAHIAMVALGLPHVIKTVSEFMNNKELFAFLKEMILLEVIPILPLPKQELEEYMLEIFDRFRNPFIEHKLNSIALNSIAKLSPRILASIRDYYDQTQALPEKLTEVFTLTVQRYMKNPESIQDTEQIKQIFSEARAIKNPEDQAEFLLGHPELWSFGLSYLKGLKSKLSARIG
ncbi:tagaturonate reductase [Algoriphagus sediminis]|uniref:Tagaturonate reductase n=1 Tax=Algoriphagus sediminis TaxID=3057113 RepID=A0ABT7YDE8_9BACT|nr:tagaturonate reductase [Algoriphagus sediminis]MDN3204508.1 tagaturonate reductase [Algoriphagus sediminis]